MDMREAVKYLLEDFHLEDKVYDVRSRAAESGDGWEGNLWEHPAVNKFSEACMALKAWLKQGEDVNGLVQRTPDAEPGAGADPQREEPAADPESGAGSGPGARERGGGQAEEPLRR